MIEWSEDMTTGIEEIDAQHKELISRFNQLDEALQEGRGREETGTILNFVQFYTDWHFGREERCMEDYGCPVAEANQHQHAWFLKEFQHLYDSYYETDTDPDIIKRTFESLETWIIEHITKTDSQLRTCSPLYQQQQSAD